MASEATKRQLDDPAQSRGRHVRPVVLCRRTEGQAQGYPEDPVHFIEDRENISVSEKNNVSTFEQLGRSSTASMS